MKVYLIIGATGAGKTTYALKLAREKNAFRFSVDEWMENLYQKDWPQKDVYSWALERTQRIEKQILDNLQQFKELRINTVLDLGFFKREHREKIYAFLDNKEIPFELHYLDVAPDVRWKRVQKRNEQKGETYSLEVTKEMFDFCEDLFEELGQDELSLDTTIVTVDHLKNAHN